MQVLRGIEEAIEVGIEEMVIKKYKYRGGVEEQSIKCKKRSSIYPRAIKEIRAFSIYPPCIEKLLGMR